MNPKVVQFDSDEIHRIDRWTMARWAGITPDQWDALSYADQCDAKEIARAEQENRSYDQAKAESEARIRARRRR